MAVRPDDSDIYEHLNGGGWVHADATLKKENDDFFPNITFTFDCNTMYSSIW